MVSSNSSCARASVNCALAPSASLAATATSLLRQMKVNLRWINLKEVQIPGVDFLTRSVGLALNRAIL
jgi:hypothetical protein